MPHDAGWSIPQDWNGEDWKCYQVQWPDSPEFQRLLISVLYTLTRGREYDGETGVIKTAQSIGWEIFDANVPLAGCADGANDDDNTDDASSRVCFGGGGVIIMEDEMAVTKVWIDYDTNELVVESGQCCEDRFPWPVVGVGGTVPQPGEDGYPDLPEGTTIDDYTACAKMMALYNVWVDVMDVILDAAASVVPPATVISLLEDKYPSLRFGRIDITTAYTAAVSVVLQGFVSEVEDPTYTKQVLCEWSLIPDNDDAGITADQWQDTIAVVVRQARKFFTALAFPTAFGNMQTLWYKSLTAIGEGDARDITTRVPSDGTEICCQQVSDLPTVPLPSGYFLGPNLASSTQYNQNVGWTQYGVRSVLPMDAYGVYVRMATGPEVNYKRMSWNETYMAGAVDVSVFTDTSETLQTEGFHLGVPLVFFADETIAEQLAAQLQTGAIIWKDAGVLGVALATIGQIIGGEIDASTLASLEVVQWRWINKVEV